MVTANVMFVAIKKSGTSRILFIMIECNDPWSGFISSGSLYLILILWLSRRLFSKRLICSPCCSCCQKPVPSVPTAWIALQILTSESVMVWRHSSDFDQSCLRFCQEWQKGCAIHFHSDPKYGYRAICW